MQRLTSIQREQFQSCLVSGRDSIHVRLQAWQQMGIYVKLADGTAKEELITDRMH